MIYEPMRVPTRPRGGALPVYQRQSGVHAPGAGVSARVDDSAARVAGAAADAGARALAGLGKTIQGAADIGLRAYDDYARSKATQLITEYRRDMNQALYGDDGILTKRGEDALDADERRAARAEELRGALLRDADDDARRYFLRLADDYDADASLKAQRHAGQQRIVMLNRNDEAAAHERGEFAIARYAHQPDVDRGVGEGLWHEEQRLRRQGCGGEALARGLKEFSSGVFGGAIRQALADGDIPSAERLLTEGSKLHGQGESASSRMTAPDIARAETAVRAARDALAARAEANRRKAAREILKGERDALYLAERGDAAALEDLARRLRDAGATEEAKALDDRAAAFRESANVLRGAAELPLPEAVNRLREMDAELETARDAPDARDAHSRRILSFSRDRLARQLAARADDLRKDPAAAAESAARFQPGQFPLPDDASLEDRAAARMDWQAKNGVPNPVPLTRREVENFAEQYERASSPGDFVAMLSEHFGERSGDALKQLVTSGKLPPDANLALNMPRESANLLMMMSRKDAVKETERALGVDKTTRNDIARAVRDELEDILGSFAAQGDSHAAAQVLDSSYKLSLKYMERGMDAKNAGERAAREVMAERYEVRDGYRVPRDYNADAVAAGARLYLENAAETVAMTPAPGLTKAQMKAKKAAILRSGGRWVNNADESGLVLTIGGAPVLDVNGSIVEVGFGELATQRARRNTERDEPAPSRWKNPRATAP